MISESDCSMSVQQSLNTPEGRVSVESRARQQRLEEPADGPIFNSQPWPKAVSLDMRFQCELNPAVPQRGRARPLRWGEGRERDGSYVGTAHGLELIRQSFWMRDLISALTSASTRVAWTSERCRGCA